METRSSTQLKEKDVNQAVLHETLQNPSIQIKEKDVTEEILYTALQALRTDLNKDFDRAINNATSELFKIIDKQAEEINILKTEVSDLKSALANSSAEFKNITIKNSLLLEKVDEKQREENVIIFGIPEQTSTDNKTENLKEIIENHLKEAFPEIVLPSMPYRLGKFNPNRKNPRPVKLEMKSVAQRNEILRWKPSTKSISTSRDYPPLTLLERKRLGDRKREMLEKKNGHEYYIKQGKLFENSDVIDEFDLRNQIFKKNF